MATDGSQHWNAEDYAHHARLVADLARPLIGLLDPKPSETILDLGCGDSVLAAEIHRPRASVIGVHWVKAMVGADVSQNSADKPAYGKLALELHTAL